MYKTVLLHFGLYLVDPGGGGVRGYTLAAGCIATNVLAFARLGAASKIDAIQFNQAGSE